MVREYERGSWEMARKAVPNFVWDYKGEHPEDAGYDPGHICRLCNTPMYFHSMKGNVARYACNGTGCANNPNSSYNIASSFDTIMAVGNKNKIWSLPKPCT